MASCFKNPNKKNLSAKDYTIKKRRNVAFKSVRNSYLTKLAASGNNFTKTGTNVACVNNKGEFTQFMNREVKLDMLRAYEDCNSVLSQLIQGQLFLKSLCSPYHMPNDNTDISNNYFGDNIQLAYGDSNRSHLTEYSGGLNQNINSTHSSTDYHNTYAEIKPGNNTLVSGKFKNNKFFFRKPLVCHNSIKASPLLPEDTVEPGVASFVFLIE